METRRAERVPDFIVARHPSEVRHAMPEINIKPVQLEPAQTAANTTARSGDIDMNNHVTNTRYVDFMLDNVPGEVRSGCRPVFSDIIYRAEALEGDNIEIRRTEADPDEVCGSMPELDTFITEYKCLAFWHNLVKSKSRFLFITREKEKELVRGFTLWA
ncbi:MAG: hypothetical protein IJD04_08455 [Desulfovibrionaceae bacterium]|nr:hypothetical protein [Desulfovibrionaceae bacterium]